MFTAQENDLYFKWTQCSSELSKCPIYSKWAFVTGWDELPMVVPISCFPLKQYVSTWHLYFSQLTWSDMNNIPGNHDWIIPLIIIHLHIGAEWRFAKARLILQPPNFWMFEFTVLTLLIYMLLIHVYPLFPLENTTLQWHAAEETSLHSKSTCLAPAVGLCPVCGTSKGRKKLGVLGTWSGESQPALPNSKSNLEFLQRQKLLGSLIPCFLLFILSRSSKRCYLWYWDFSPPFSVKFLGFDPLNQSSRT